eukprot:comp23984_c0_seq1/m.42584 comp23984_c0_seq1/g.42584  ORF comp23984_c0_seq1/g.42584 comp23984_c0_seq1/m.42584 type:complete len:537 (+) comp23984_c0_seq1:111-1721(+)
MPYNTINYVTSNHCTRGGRGSENKKNTFKSLSYQMKKHYRGTGLIHLEDVALLLLEVNEAHVGIGLGQPTGLHKAADNGVAHVACGPSGAAQVEVAVALVEVLVEDLLVLGHLVLDVHLVRLVPAERQPQTRQQAVLGIGLQLLAVQVLLGARPGPKVQHHGAHLDPPCLVVGPLLDERPEGGHAGAQAGHDDGLLVAGGQDHDRGLDRDRHLGAHWQVDQVAGALAHLVGAAGRGPVVQHDQQVHAVGVHLHAGRNRVVAGLDGRHNLDQRLDRRVCRGELPEQLCIGDGLVHAGLEVLLAVSRGNGQQLLLLHGVAGQVGQLLVEALAGPPKQVQHLLQPVVHCARLHKAWALLVAADRHHVVGLEPVPVNELANLLVVVVPIHPQGITNLVAQPGAADVHLQVEHVALVIAGRQALVLRQRDRVATLLGRVHKVLGGVLLAEDGLPGGLVPLAELALGHGHNAVCAVGQDVAVHGLAQGHGRSSSSSLLLLGVLGLGVLGLGPASRHPDLGQGCLTLVGRRNRALEGQVVGKE